MTGRSGGSRAAALGLALVCGGVAAPSSSSAQERARPLEQEAAEHFHRGIEFFNEGRHDAAVAEFQRAYDLAPAFEVLYNLGRVHAELGHAVEASDAYRRFLDEGGGRVREDQRREVESALLRQLARIARLSVTANVDGAVVSVDGVDVTQTPVAQPLRVSAGSHTVGVRAPGYEGVTRRVLIAGRVEETLHVELRPDVIRMGTLRITSSVPDVAITIDGAEAGTTPLGVTVPVTEGNHQIMGTRPGYEPTRTWVSVPFRAEVEVRLAMRRSDAPRSEEVGSVQLGIPDAPYVLEIDGEPVLARDGRLELPVGRHHLELLVADRLPYETDLEVPRGQVAELRLALRWTPDAQADLLGDARRRERLGEGFTFAGVGVVAGSTGMLAWVRSEIDATNAAINDAEDACAGGSDTSDTCDYGRGEALEDEGARLSVIERVSWSLGAVGLVCVVIGLWVWIATPSEAELERSARASLRLELLPGGARLRGTF